MLGKCWFFVVGGNFSSHFPVFFSISAIFSGSRQFIDGETGKEVGKYFKKAESWWIKRNRRRIGVQIEKDYERSALEVIGKGVPTKVSAIDLGPTMADYILLYLRQTRLFAKECPTINTSPSVSHSTCVLTLSFRFVPQRWRRRRGSKPEHAVALLNVLEMAWKTFPWPKPHLHTSHTWWLLINMLLYVFTRPFKRDISVRVQNTFRKRNVFALFHSHFKSSRVCLAS